MVIYMFILLVGIAIASVVIGFGVKLIKNAEKLSGDQKTANKIYGIEIIVVGVVILVSTFVLASVFSDINKQDWMYVGFIALGIAVMFLVIVGIAFARGLTLSEFFHRVEIGEAEEKISEKTRKKIGILILVGSVVLTVIFVVLVITNPLRSISNKVERNCPYCGDEGAYYEFGSYYYCEDCYDGLVDAKERVENN